MYIEGYLHYSAEVDLIMLCDTEVGQYGLHCGDGVEVFDNGKWKHLAVEVCDGKDYETTWCLTDYKNVVLKNFEGMLARTDEFFKD
jgi:hypothetical protein